MTQDDEYDKAMAKQMATANNSLQTPPSIEDPATLRLDPSYVRQEDTDKRSISARAMSGPDVRAASIIQALNNNLDINFLAAELRAQIGDVHDGNMARAEAMLVAQAHTLDALFAGLSRQAIHDMNEGHGEAFERYMKLALRAQSQCRATVEALSAIKNPPVIYAKQANIAHGPQQVNNGVSPGDELRAEEIKKAPNELGEHSHELSPDTCAQGLAGHAMPGAEALAEIHRAKNR